MDFTIPSNANMNNKLLCGSCSKIFSFKAHYEAPLSTAVYRQAPRSPRSVRPEQRVASISGTHSPSMCPEAFEAT
ncbi:hypothetical protein M8J77_025681 [Diaphorina citri]|nr:hypothetical protein M8J77_025681 [Diaphorina citri]